MMTRAQALAIYQSGPEVVVQALLEMDARIDAIMAKFEKQVSELNGRLEISEKRVKHLEDKLAKNSHKSGKPRPAMDWTGSPPRA